MGGAGVSEARSVLGVTGAAATAKESAKERQRGMQSDEAWPAWPVWDVLAPFPVLFVPDLDLWWPLSNPVVAQRGGSGCGDDSGDDPGDGDNYRCWRDPGSDSD